MHKAKNFILLQKSHLKVVDFFLKCLQVAQFVHSLPQMLNQEDKIFKLEKSALVDFNVIFKHSSTLCGLKMEQNSKAMGYSQTVREFQV